jgi:soluble lytic murein transglycosylase
MRRFTKPALAVLAALIAAAAPAPARAQAPATDIAALKAALAQVEAGKSQAALAASAKFRDPAARKLVTWLALRVDWKNAGFDRALAFLGENPDWPSRDLIRRRAESLLYDEKRDARTVRAFFADAAPLSGEGKLALARALLSSGDKIGALPLVQSAWREETLSPEIERETLAAFKDMLVRADHAERSARLFYARNYTAAARAAAHGGADLVALDRARTATSRRAKNANALISAVPKALQDDPSLAYARAQFRWRNDDFAGAGQMLLSAPRDPAKHFDTDNWWREARVVVRGLLDRDDARTAYRVAVHSGLPASENYKADQQFTAGWIALRFLKDPASARKHFAAIEKFSEHPITLARAFYWQGRAAEAVRDEKAARAFYERAGGFTTAYYGQLARARIGLTDLPLNRPLEPAATDRAQFDRLEPVRALRLLYAADRQDLTVPFYTGLASSAAQARLVLLASVAYERRDARAMVLVGKAGYDRGILLDSIAFPIFGIPDFPAVDPPVDRALVYAIARQESQFMQSAASHANALGLMQVIPPTARAIARRIGVKYELSRLRNDPAYNARFGAAELGHLKQQFNGSYILTFVGYNAGPGRSREWMGRYGDPRDPKVDAVDWVERVPFSETRYYIQRVMENMQVYRVLFGDGKGFTIEADLARGG